MTIDDQITLIDDLVDTTDEDYPRDRKIRALNKAQDQLVNIILESDTLSVFDDPNYTDLPEGYLDLVSGQTVYDLSQDENFANLLYIVKVFNKDSAGKFQEVFRQGTNDPLIQRYLRDIPTVGTPRFFRVSSKRIILGSSPNYSSTEGIKVFFQREPKPISVNDTTRQMGLPSTFHQLAATMAAYDYARAKRMDTRNDLLTEVYAQQAKLGIFVQNQDQENQTRIGTIYRNPR